MKQKLTLALLLVSACNLVQVNAKNGSILNDLSIITNLARTYKCGADSIQALQQNLQANKEIADELLDNAMDQAVDCLEECKDKLTAEELQRLAESLEQLYEETLITKGKKRFDNLTVRKQLNAGSVYVGGDETVNHNLYVNGSEVITGNLTIGGSIIFTSTTNLGVSQAALSANTAALTASTFNALPFNNIISNPVGALNPVNGTFTAPQAGYYNLTSAVTTQSTNALTNVPETIGLSINGAAPTATNTNSTNVTAAANAPHTLSISRLVYLPQGATVSTQVNPGTDAATVALAGSQITASYVSNA